MRVNKIEAPKALPYSEARVRWSGRWRGPQASVSKRPTTQSGSKVVKPRSEVGGRSVTRRARMNEVNDVAKWRSDGWSGSSWRVFFARSSRRPDLTSGGSEMEVGFSPLFRGKSGRNERPLRVKAALPGSSRGFDTRRLEK